MAACTCNLSYSGAWGGKIALAQEFKVQASHDRTTALPFEWQSKTLSQKNLKKKKTEKNATFLVYPLSVITKHQPTATFYTEF